MRAFLAANSDHDNGMSVIWLQITADKEDSATRKKFEIYRNKIDSRGVIASRNSSFSFCCSRKRPFKKGSLIALKLILAKICINPLWRHIFTRGIISPRKQIYAMQLRLNILQFCKTFYFFKFQTCQICCIKFGGKEIFTIRNWRAVGLINNCHRL